VNQLTSIRKIWNFVPLREETGANMGLTHTRITLEKQTPTDGDQPVSSGARLGEGG
jgi:hypothetical protein